MLGLRYIVEVDSDTSEYDPDPFSLTVDTDNEDYEFFSAMDLTAYAQEIASILPSIRQIDLWILDRERAEFFVSEGRVSPNRPLLD